MTGTGENLRVNPVNGLVTTDAALIWDAGDRRRRLHQQLPGSVTTTLYDIDFAADTLAIQSPPNNGTLATVGTGLGITTQLSLNISFDISPDGNAAYLLARAAGVVGLYTVNLTTGTATLVGGVGDGATSMRGFTVAENDLPDRRRGDRDRGRGRRARHGRARLSAPRRPRRLRDGERQRDRRRRLRRARARSTSRPARSPRRSRSRCAMTRWPSREASSVTPSNPGPDVGATATLAGPSAATVTIADDDASSGDSGGSGAGGTGGVDRLVKLLAFAQRDQVWLLRRRGLRVRFSCSEACIDKTLFVGRRAIATSSARLAAADLGALRLRPSRRRAFAAIGARRQLKVALTAVDAAGNAGTDAFRVRLL